MTRDNAEFVKRFYSEMVGHGRLDAAEDLLAADYVDHDVAPGHAGRNGIVSWLRAFDEGFRNRSVVLDDYVESGDVVSVRWSLTATHTRAFLGFPASGETVEVTGTSVFRIEEERIVERWNHEDGLGLMRQLTLLSAQSVKQDPRFQPGYTRTVALAGAI
ncbi:MAG TPA: ester cyclase [Dehalococcoidia bacterium]|jgi:steroid delta-isomerase-like uncharacterized protein|nr:ester cyclase [Dehalococcoidia bacterium]